MTQYPDLFAALAAPFDPSEVRVRSQSGRQLHYITARTAMNRLDTVLGPENWWDHYLPGENSVLCQLTIRLPDGSTLTKCDAGGYAGMADSGDDDKSGYSDAFKRAAVKFGVARYLYRDGVPTFVQERAGVNLAPEPQAPRDPRPGDRPHPPQPRDEAPAHRGGDGDGRRGGEQGQGNGGGRGNYGNRPPTTGKALFAWTKDQEQQHAVGLLKYLNGWAKLQEFPGRMVDWDAEQVQLAYAEAVRKLAAIQRGGGDDVDPYEEALAN